MPSDDRSLSVTSEPIVSNGGAEERRYISTGEASGVEAVAAVEEEGALLLEQRLRISSRWAELDSTRTGAVGREVTGRIPLPAIGATGVACCMVRLGCVVRA